MSLKKLNRFFILSCTSVGFSFSLAACGGSAHSNPAGQNSANQRQLQQPQGSLTSVKTNPLNASVPANDQADAASDLKALADANYNPSQASASTQSAKTSTNGNTSANSQPSKQDLEKALVAVIALKADGSQSGAVVANSTDAPSLHRAATQTDHLPPVSAQNSKDTQAKVVPAKKVAPQKVEASVDKPKAPQKAPVVVAKAPAPQPTAPQKPVVVESKVSIYRPIIVRTQKFDPNGLKPEQIFASSEPTLNPANGSAQTGLTSAVLNERGQALVFSGASSEDLLANLRLADEAIEMQSPDQHSLNESLAKRVNSASVRVQKPNQVQVSFIFDRQLVKISGTFKPAEPNSKLREAQLVSPEFPNLKVQLTCIDLVTKQCLTARLDLTEKSIVDGIESNATLVSRVSGTYFFARGEAQTGNPNVDLWLSLANRTADKKSNNVISALNFETSETVDGPSTYVVSVHAFVDGKDLPTLILRGELLKENDGILSNARVKVQSEQPSILSESILSARLIKNDGHGNLMFRLLVKNDRSNTPNEILLTVARR
jgi:hypothetical protein